ncbi:MAG: hypothetical protein H6636_12520 [Anaerolineales bacterium]|nr:hypothetical protein [Anaerolineales bacterium]
MGNAFAPHPHLIYTLPSGHVELCNMQFLRGYCILRAVPTVASLNGLSPAQRAQFLTDMARVGDALLEVTGAYRINYGLFGNSDPTLHAHIVPRYLTEPDEYRLDLPWNYPQAHIDALCLDLARDQPLMQQIAHALQHSL